MAKNNKNMPPAENIPAQEVQNTPKLKLNHKRTIYIGMAFFTIMMLWQVYNTYCPLFLSDFFVNQLHLYDSAEKCSYLVGIIMAMDNVFALFMIPLFGMWSDRTKTPLGKRMPFIIVGVVASVILFPLIPVAFIQGQVVWMIVLMGLILLFMNIYRNPAVSLMPDITPKPLRSKANAIINVIGYVGAIFAGVLAMIFTAKDNAGVLEYNPSTIWVPFALTAVLMVLALIVLLTKIKENKLAVEMKDQMELGEKLAETSEQIAEDKPLGKVEKRNLVVLLLAIFLWFFAFNAIETFGSTYGLKVLEQSSSWWGSAVIVMTICSLLGFFPGAWLADKVGRRNTIMIGLGIMVFTLGIASIMAFTLGTKLAWLYYILIGLAGVGWAWINVNSYPMVVEMASKKNIGRLTGWYYAASMLAQSITPIFIGFLFGVLGYQFLFPYAVIFSGVALLVFLFYRPQKHN
ncbi:MAG: MFS transporter [Clostridia bacterium]|nr:MFS transporter [Clostridia bacterium]